MTTTQTRGTILLLTAQALFFGFAGIFLVVPANGIFLAAYGARWLPLTYIGIAVLGSLASVAIARSLRRWSLSGVAVVVLSAQAVLVLATWLVMTLGDMAWPSVVQLMLFPILLQISFVIIGGQAGRLLDLQQIKAHFPRIVSGFVVGLMIGGFATPPLVSLLGSPEHVVVLSAVALVVFVALVRLTAGRRRAELTTVDSGAGADDRPPLRALLTSRLVVLVFAYQFLSAMGSWVLDFFAFDRAAARYPDAADLTRFIGLYTGVMNLVNLAFLGILAGWLLRRFGLRLGLSANPVVVTLLAAVMVLTALGPGAASFALFALAASTRVIDIALTDGMTRGSINAVYQVIPVEERIAVQASVEGVGVPVAIGATGALLMVLNLLELGPVAVTVFALVLCAAWSAAAFVVYADYQRALGVRLRRRGLDMTGAVPVSDEEQTAARRLVLTDDVRDVRLGLELSVTANLADADLASLAQHADRDVRLLALCELARRGDGEAARQAAKDVRALAASSEPDERHAAAVVLAQVEVADQATLLGPLLRDPDASVRAAALDAIGAAEVDLLDDVLAQLADPASVEPAQRALARIGEPALMWAAAHLASVGSHSPASMRYTRVLHTASAISREGRAALMDVALHPDLDVSAAALTTLARLDRPVEASIVEELRRDARLAACALAASQALEPGDDAVRRALDDLLATIRSHVFALVAVRVGAERVAGARRALDHPDGSQRALGVELLQVSLLRPEMALVELLVVGELAPDERLRRLSSVVEVPRFDRSGWLEDLVRDPEGRWRSTWLAALALDALRRSDAHHVGALAAPHRERSDPALAEVVTAVLGPADDA